MTVYIVLAYMWS